jgi:large subunit ribosomal protein L25
MLSLTAKIRKETGKKVKKLRYRDLIPAVLYGPKIKKALSLELNYGSFEKIYKDAGESSLISLEIEGEDKKNLVLIHEIQRDPLTSKFSHVDFYQAPLEEKIVVKIPIVLEGISPAVKDLGGTLVKHISETEVKAFPQNLPKELKVKVEVLKTFEDNIKISDLPLSKDVEILRDANEIVASVLRPERVEEELEKPIEEKVEEVEKVEKEKKEAEVPGEPEMNKND